MERGCKNQIRRFSSMVVRRGLAGLFFSRLLSRLPGHRCPSWVFIKRKALPDSRYLGAPSLQRWGRDSRASPRSNRAPTSKDAGHPLARIFAHDDLATDQHRGPQIKRILRLIRVHLSSSAAKDSSPNQQPNPPRIPGSGREAGHLFPPWRGDRNRIAGSSRPGRDADACAAGETAGRGYTAAKGPGRGRPASRERPLGGDCTRHPGRLHPPIPNEAAPRPS
jgi:hypothetical protein